MVNVGNGAGAEGLIDGLGRPLNRVARSNRLTYMPWTSQAVVYAAPGAAKTFFYTLPIDDDITSFRLIFNQQPGGPAVTITAASAVISNAANDYGNPTGGGTPVSVTWNNAGVDIDIPAPFRAAGNLTTRTIPGAPAVDPIFGSANVWLPDLSDWVSITPPAGAVGTRYLMLRVLIPNAPYYGGTMSGGYTAAPLVNKGHDLCMLSLPGDSVTGFPVVVVSLANADFTGPLRGYQVMSRSAGLTVATIGDSEYTNTTAGGINGFCVQAWNNWAAAGGNGIYAPAQMNWTGAQSALYAALASYLLPIVKPQIAFISGFTWNEGSGSLVTALPRAQWLAERVRAYGGVPIIVGPFADTERAFQGAAANRAPWLAAIAKVRGMASSGTLVYDPASVCGVFDPVTGILNGAIVAALAGDLNHENDAGHAAHAAAILPILQSVPGAF